MKPQETMTKNAFHGDNYSIFTFYINQSYKENPQGVQN
jgi:hypothetical protein